MMWRLLRHEWLFTAGMALLLVLFASATAGSIAPLDTGSVRIQLDPAQAGVHAKVNDNADALLLGSQQQGEVTARLNFTLPENTPGGSHWVLWMERNPVDQVWLTRGDWRSVEHGFFDPSENEGPLPVGFSFSLPMDWQGEIALDLHVRSSLQTVLRPRLMSVTAASMIERRGIVISTFVYASLFTIALLVLALYAAARDRMFLALFGCTSIALLALAAANGHLYAANGWRWFGAWSANGLLALGFMLCAATLQLLQQYAATRNNRVELARMIDRFCVGLVVMAAVCMLDLHMLLTAMQWLAVACWIISAGIGLLLVLEAARRRAPMAWPLAVLALLVIGSGVLREMVILGQPFDFVWARCGYQIAIVAFVAILAVGLVSRISEYRDQRDRDLLARLDSELRMQREAARSDLNAALLTDLRACSESDIEWTAFRLLLDRLLPLLRVENAQLVARGYHGQDVDVVMPVTRKADADASLARRELTFKRYAANGIPLQQPVIVPDAQGKVAMEAIIPLQIRAPAWGMMLVERMGGDGFTTEELALAGEFSRLAVMHIEQALATAQLRRSAELDALTGTFNRRTIDQWMARSFTEAIRDGQPWSVLFVDLDHFKSVNDRYGHACGDHCLRVIAQTLRSALAEGDLLGRYGGEEFIAVLPGSGGAAARQVGEQLRSAVERQAVEWEGQSLPLTVSVGAATRLSGEDKPSQTIDRADKALYMAKRGGRNCIQVAPAIFS